MNNLQWKVNAKARELGVKTSVDYLERVEVDKVRRFHQTFEAYQMTPLTSLPDLASYLDVAGVYVKDESYRFSLNAFKVLGGTYAIGRYLAERLDIQINELSFELLQSKEMKEKTGDITFITATDGNHGRGMAWAAQQLGQKAIVYMPKGSSEIRLNNILATGAEAYITEWNYDECVRYCATQAKEHGYVVVQDTAWDGYEEIPQWIMQGYSTLALEAIDQLDDIGIAKPTHVFLQAGVGSFAGSIQGVFAAAYGDERPITVIVEPNKADCLYKSAVADDGNPRHVTGALDTIMAGLACGEPNPASWKILNDYSDMFISCPDYVAANGMRILGNPLGQDKAIISGESGAVTAGIVNLLMKDPAYADMRQQLQLDENSHVLLISTEGDTDPIHYRNIVWEGSYGIPTSV